MVLACTCLVVVMLLMYPWRSGRLRWDESDLRRMRRMSDRVHADERLPHE